MSKTYVYCLIVIGVFLFIIKPVTKKEEKKEDKKDDGKLDIEDETILNDFQSSGIMQASTQTNTSSKPSNNPTYTI